MHAHRRLVVSRRALLIDLGVLGAGALVVSGCSNRTISSSSPAPEETDEPGSSTISSSRWARANLGFVSAYVLVRDGEAIVVDVGPSGSESAIEATLIELGAGWNEVSNVVLTHRHPDHVGSLGAIAELAASATYSTGAADVDGIGLDLGLVGLVDGDLVGGLRVIATPGHTAGHIAVLDEFGGVLVAGDAINGGGSGVTGPNPDFTDDMVAANASVRVLAGFDYETVYFGHGEPLENGGTLAVGALADGLG